MNIMTWLRKNRISRILMAFVAGVLLLITTTACSGTLAKNPRPEVPSTDLTSPYRGGMNDFSDVDPRARKSEEAAEAKTKVLEENAERNVIDHSGDLRDLGKNLQRNAEETKDKAQGAAGDLAKEAKRSAEDVKDTTLGKGKELTESVRNKAEDVKQAVKTNTPDADDLKSSAKATGRNIKENTKAAGRDIVDKAEETGDKTATTLQDKIKQVTRGAQRTVENAGDAVKDAID